MNKIKSTIKQINNTRQNYLKQEEKLINENKLYSYNWIIGVSIFLIIFLVIVPFFIYKYNKPYLIYYLPNIDIIALVLTLTSIFYPDELPFFYDLYSQVNVKWYHLLSSLVINVFVLYWLFVIVIRHSKNTNEQLLIFTVVITFAYFLPTYYIPFIGEYLHKTYDVSMYTWLSVSALILLVIIYVERKLVSFLLPLKLISKQSIKQHFGIFD